jgi:hypothetical protein
MRVSPSRCESRVLVCIGKHYRLRHSRDLIFESMSLPWPNSAVRQRKIEAHDMRR